MINYNKILIYILYIKRLLRNIANFFYILHKYIINNKANFNKLIDLLFNN